MYHDSSVTCVEKTGTVPCAGTVPVTSAPQAPYFFFFFLLTSHNGLGAGEAPVDDPPAALFAAVDRSQLALPRTVLTQSVSSRWKVPWLPSLARLGGCRGLAAGLGDGLRQWQPPRAWRARPLCARGRLRAAPWSGLSRWLPWQQPCVASRRVFSLTSACHGSSCSALSASPWVSWELGLRQRGALRLSWQSPGSAAAHRGALPVVVLAVAPAVGFGLSSASAAGLRLSLYRQPLRLGLGAAWRWQAHGRFVIQLS